MAVEESLVLRESKRLLTDLLIPLLLCLQGGHHTITPSHRVTFIQGSRAQSVHALVVNAQSSLPEQWPCMYLVVLTGDHLGLDELLGIELIHWSVLLDHLVHPGLRETPQQHSVNQTLQYGTTKVALNELFHLLHLCE